MYDSGWLHLQSWISRKTHEHYWSQQNRIEKEDKKPQVQTGKHTIYYKTWGKGTLTSSFDIYVSRKGLLILNTPHYWPSHSCNNIILSFSKTRECLFQIGITLKVSSLYFPFPSTALKLVQTMQIMKELEGKLLRRHKLSKEEANFGSLLRQTHGSLSACFYKHWEQLGTQITRDSYQNNSQRAEAAAD